MNGAYISFYNIIFFTVFPVFAVILTGVLLRSIKCFDKNFASGLLTLVFYVTLPALMFLEMAKTSVSDIINWQIGELIVAFAVAQLIVFLIAVFIEKALLHSSSVNAFISALTASVSNTALLGIPLLIGLFGNSVVVPATVTVAFSIMIFMPIVFFVMERLSNHESGERTVFYKVLFNSIKNPLVLAPLAGFCFSLTNVKLPYVVASYANYLQSATVSCALLAIGLTLDVQTVRGYFKYSLWVSFLKLFVLPFIALLIIRAFHAPPLYTIVTVMVCSIPTAKMIMMLSLKYGSDIERSASALFVSHLIGFVSMLFWIIILNMLYPSYFLYFANISFT